MMNEKVTPGAIGGNLSPLYQQAYDIFTEKLVEGLGWKENWVHLGKSQYLNPSETKMFSVNLVVKPVACAMFAMDGNRKTEIAIERFPRTPAGIERMGKLAEQWCREHK